VNAWKYVAATAAILALGVSIAYAAGLLNLPLYYVYATHANWPQGAYTTLDVTLNGVGEGYDVSDRTYNGWCLEDNKAPDPGPHFPVILMDTTDPSSFVSPCNDQIYLDIPWDKVNYLLNHRQGDYWDLQLALWVVAGTDYVVPPRTLTVAAQAMIDDANDNGEGFFPQPSQIMAVALCADGLSGEVNTSDLQDTFIEVTVPRGGEGCTPGYWKQEHHFDSWRGTGYRPNMRFDRVFGVRSGYPRQSLVQAARMGGGKEKALRRHAVAALLNASSPNVHYYYSVDEVISMVRRAYRSENFNRFKNRLERANEMGCPLN
jgi:hypothetical protein